MSAGLPPSERKTEYVTVQRPGGPWDFRGRPVHYKRVELIKIGSDYYGKAVWTSYPEAAALCGAGIVARADGPATCARCIARHRQAEAAAQAAGAAG